MNNLSKIIIAALLAVLIGVWVSPSEARGTPPLSSGHGRTLRGLQGPRGGYAFRPAPPLDYNGHTYRPGHFYGRDRRVWWGPRFYWGGSVVLGPWYPYYYAAAPPQVIVQQQPPVYIQPEHQPGDYWYYCQDPQGYYPYVKSCPGGWMKVVPEVIPPNQ